MEKNESKPLDLEDIWEWFDKHFGEDAIDRYYGYETERLIAEIKQRIKEACEFYKEWWNNPKTFVIWYEDKRKVNELIKFMEHWFGEYWQDKFDSLEDKRIKIILKYNEWLFKLAFNLKEEKENV